VAVLRASPSRSCQDYLAGIEARSYALSTACAVWLTVLVVAAARRDRSTWWFAYALALVGSTVLNLFAILIVLPHLIAVTLCAARRGVIWRWDRVGRWCTRGVGTLCVLLRTQIAQVRWISPLSSGTLLEIGYQQYFDRSASIAIAAAVLVLACIAFAGSLCWTKELDSSSR